MNRPLIALTLAAALAAPALAATAYDTILAGAWRSDANKARDQYRHPAQTLSFIGIKPTMTVVEIWPSGGWYTEILAPYLKDKGQLYGALGYSTDPAKTEKSVTAFKTKFAAVPGGDKVKLTAFGKDSGPIAPAGSADAVLTFRNVHNWYIGGFAPQAFAAFNTALKPGGILGIEEHRLPEDKPDAMQKDSGYMKRSTVVKLATDAGFKLVGESKVNANPKDTHDYPKGVWTLPPNYTEGDKDRAKYAAIGESDRMTLKFVKVR